MSRRHAIPGHDRPLPLWEIRFLRLLIVAHVMPSMLVLHNLLLPVPQLLIPLECHVFLKDLVRPFLGQEAPQH